MVEEDLNIMGIKKQASNIQRPSGMGEDRGGIQKYTTDCRT
jgi:hypothetical protein